MLFNSERAEVEKKMADLSGKNEALNILLEKERENTANYMATTKERYQERRLELERRLNDTSNQMESKLEEAERWKKRLQDENDDLRSMVNVLKTTSFSGGGANSDQLTKELTRELSKLDSNVGKDVAYISETLHSFVDEVKDMHQEKFDLRLKYEMEKEMAQMEKRHAQQINDAKNLSSSVMEKLRESYEEEIRDLREQIKTLEKAKELHLVKLVEKEGHVKIL